MSDTHAVSAEDAYERWLFHGPLFQVIEKLDGLDRHGIDATVRPACSRQCVGTQATDGWLIDPIVLDAAPQLSILWSRATHGTTPLPSRLARYHRFGPIGTEPVELRWRVDPGHDGQNLRAKVWFLRDGRVVGQMDGLEGAGSAGLNRLAAGVQA
jgi:hypothetical protein